jgi:hypothetical protein
VKLRNCRVRLCISTLGEDTPFFSRSCGLISAGQDASKMSTPSTLCVSIPQKTFKFALIRGKRGDEYGGDPVGVHCRGEPPWSREAEAKDVENVPCFPQ